MTIRKAYSGTPLSGRMQIILIRWFTFFGILVVLSSQSNIFGQEQSDYDEIAVFLDIPRLGGTDMTAVIRGDILYLPVTDLFDFLKIKNVPTSGLESVSGFFINPEATYLISRTDNIIRYQDKTITLEPGDLIRTESNLYLRSSYFGKVFGLDCNFNFRSLSVTVNSKLELPLIHEMRLEEMRKNLTRLKGNVKADTTLGRSYPLFRFGMADWSAITTEEIKGKSDARLNLNLGAMIAGGETTANLYYSSTEPFTEKQQYYLWRYVDNDYKLLRQAAVGKIATNATSTIYNPVIGVQFTNTPTTYRRSFGTYTLSDRTEPGWVVELYVNNVLVDYVKADASGFFTFEVPLVYGNTIVKLKFYGPWGEERVREQNINIPFNFLPKNTLEYNVSAGFVEDTVFSRFSRASVNYGITRKLTIGTGVEYLSSVVSTPAMPYFNASMSILNNILLSGEFTLGVRAKGTLSYRLPSNLQLDLNYTKYYKNQKAINYNYLEERKAVLAIPLRIKNFSTYQRFTVYQILLPASKYTTGEWMFSGSLFGVNSNLTTYALFVDRVRPNVYSNLSLSIRLTGDYVILPQIQYGVTQGKLLTAKLGLEKRLIEHGYLNMSFEQNFAINIPLAEVGFRYDFAFAQTGVSARQSDKRTTLVQYARGSLINDSKTKYLGTDNRTNVGKGGISIIPYLDLNGNGVKDPDEPKVYGLNVRASGGRVEKSERDTTIRILGLEPYTNCFIELDPNSFDNVSWKLPVQTMNVAVDPDVLKHIEIPIIIVGEASGMISIEKNGEKKGLGRIIIRFYNQNLKSVGRTLSEDDGYFSYMGLAPGSYTVRIDTSQLRKLSMTSDPQSLHFRIKSGREGDIADNLDFTLHSQIDTMETMTPAKPSVRKDTTTMIVHEVSQELVTITEDSYSIQLGAFQKKSNAEALRSKLEKLLGRKVEIITENDLYKVRINDIKNRTEVDAVIEQLRKNGITELWLISLKAKRQQYVSSERQDTITNITETIIQAGAFMKESNAIALKELLSKSLYQKVVIDYENGLFKVRIIGTALLKETILEEMKKLSPLKDIELKDLWILPVKNPKMEKLPETIVTEVAPSKVVPPKEVEKTIKVPIIVPPDSAEIPLEKTMKAPILPAEPKFSLQAGVFYKKSEAVRAQHKISSKLKLPVEIVQQWEYYRVIIPGFYTKEETYRYYPELAGLGYPGVSLIEKK